MLGKEKQYERYVVARYSTLGYLIQCHCKFFHLEVFHSFTQRDMLFYVRPGSGMKICVMNDLSCSPFVLIIHRGL